MEEELNHGDVEKKKRHMLPFKKKKRSSATQAFSQNEDNLCYFKNSGIEQCCLVLFNLLFCVNVDFMDCLKPVCFMLIIYIFPLQKNKRTKKKDIIALAHTKKWILSQEGQGSRVPTPRHFNVHFYDESKRKKKKKKKKG